MPAADGMPAADHTPTADCTPADRMDTAIHGSHELNMELNSNTTQVSHQLNEDSHGLNDG
ncbi:hypothetical protein DXG01_016759, partial [Tephrocybe rancida]